jgi:hypothetical protein
MRAINISNEKKRNAEVGFDALPRRRGIIMTLPEGGEKRNVKFIKSSADLDRMLAVYGDLKKLGEAIIAGDPEVDMEMVGRLVGGTHKLYLTGDNEIAYQVNLMQVTHNPDGGEKERKDLAATENNISKPDAPVLWSGRYFPKKDAIKKFVFTRKYQLRHTSGLTFDFLHDMAKNLQEKDALMYVRAGAKGNEALRLNAGGDFYQGFLEGRVEGERYCLILHLSSMELKPLPAETKDQGVPR